MHKKSRFVLLLLLVQVVCGCNTGQNQDKIIAGTKHKATIKNTLKHDVFFQYFDIQMNMIAIEIKPNEIASIDTDSSTFIYLGLTPYLIYPNDTIEIREKNRSNFLRIHDNNDKKNASLDFFNRLGTFYLGTYSAGKTQVNLKEDYHKNLLFLQEYTTKQQLSADFESVIGKFLYFDWLGKSVNLSQIQKTDLPDSLLKVFQCDECVDRSIITHSFALAAFLGAKKYNRIEKYEFVSKNYTGKTKDRLLFAITFPEKELDFDFETNFVKFKNEVKNTSFLAKIEKQISFLKETNKIRATSEVLNMDKKPFPFLNLINHQITYLDFWASWCGPCRAEMPASKTLKAEYEKKGIRFVYISTDENLEAWERANKQLGFLPQESYLLPKGNESTLVKQFKINTIPRYMIFGKDGKVINADAPRPSDPRIKQIFNELLKQK